MPKTKYKRNRNEMPLVDLDAIAMRKDTDILLRFGGVEFVIQYRVENALRTGHPFIDIVVAPGDPAIVLDMCDDDGAAIDYELQKGQRVAQILMGQNLNPGSES